MATRVRRLGLIGDVHAEHRRLEAALEHLIGEGVDAICCTGDVVDGTGDVDACCNLLTAAKVLCVAGNHDRWLLADRMRNVPFAHRLSDLAPFSCDYLESLPSMRTIETARGSALLCHGVGANDMRKVWPGTARMPIERSPELDELIEHDDIAFLLNGHLHYRVIVNFERLTLLNAGTLRGDHRPGVSILDFETQTASAFEFASDCTLQHVAELPTRDAGRRIWRDTQEFDSAWTPVTLYAA